MDRAAGALWTGTGSPPWAYVLYRARKMYGCTPSELAQEDFETMMQDIQLENLERKIAQG